MSLLNNNGDIEMLDKTALKEVFTKLKDRKIHPTGTFDNAGRFHALHSDLIDVRQPSRKWPHSHMLACCTLKYVTKVAEKFEC